MQPVLWVVYFENRFSENHFKRWVSAFNPLFFIAANNFSGMPRQPQYLTCSKCQAMR